MHPTEEAETEDEIRDLLTALKLWRGLLRGRVCEPLVRQQAEAKVAELAARLMRLERSSRY